MTGKLSDVAGMVFFPLLLASLVELARFHWRHSRGWSVTRRELAGAALGTGTAFAAIRVVPAAGVGYAGALAVLRWLPAGLATSTTFVTLPVAAHLPAVPPLPRIHHVMDISDCLCLRALWWSHRIGVRARDLR